MSKSFQSSQIKQNLLSFLFVFLALKLIFSSCAECQMQVSWPQVRAEAK